MTMRSMALAAVVFSCIAPSCGIFEPRDAEEPTQSGALLQPATSAESVIANLKASIAEKNSVNYAASFASPPKTQRTFIFTPSEEAANRYANLRQWTATDESNYFRNLATLAKQRNGFSKLELTQREFNPSTDSVSYRFSYELTMEHGNASLPTTASGDMLVFLASERDATWFIYRWQDIKTTSATTWSDFKGKFSN